MWASVSAVCVCLGSAAGTRARPAQIIGQAAPESTSTSTGGSTGGGTFVPLTPSNVDYSASNAQQAAAAQQQAVGKPAQEEPVYSFYPVLNENRWLWQFLHSVLMLLSFCFLLPLGSLLARHKWIFGRDPLSVSSGTASWWPEVFRPACHVGRLQGALSVTALQPADVSGHT